MFICLFIYLYYYIIIHIVCIICIIISSSSSLSSSIHIIIIIIALGRRNATLSQEPQKLSPPPTSGFPRVRESTEQHGKTKNSLAAGIGGVGISFCGCCFRPLPRASAKRTFCPGNEVFHQLARPKLKHTFVDIYI